MSRAPPPSLQGLCGHVTGVVLASSGWDRLLSPPTATRMTLPPQRMTHQSMGGLNSRGRDSSVCTQQGWARALEKSLWSSSDGAKWVATCLPPGGAVPCRRGLGPPSRNPDTLAVGSEGCSPARLPAPGLPCHLPSHPVLRPASDSVKSPALAAKGPAARVPQSPFAGPRTTQAVETTRKFLVGAPGASGLVIRAPRFPLPWTEEVTESGCLTGLAPATPARTGPCVGPTACGRVPASPMS